MAPMSWIVGSTDRCRVADPQTSGGPLIAIYATRLPKVHEFERLLLEMGEQIHCIGSMRQRRMSR